MIVGLPYDAEVEYLESDGQSYLTMPNTIFAKENNAKFSISMARGNPTITADFPIITANSSSHTSPSYIKVTTSGVVYGNNYVVDSRSLITDGNQHLITMVGEIRNSSYLTNYLIDGVPTGLMYTKRDLSYDGTASIFAFNQGGSIAPGGIRVYSVLALSGAGQKTCDLIPVRIGSGENAVGYMYDRVTRKLFGNSGSGKFIIGQDISIPILGLHMFEEKN